MSPGSRHRDRDLAIDMAKGCAILWVLLIHSKALGDTLMFRQVVNQAVPIFVVLFGLNSSLWWQERGLGTAMGPWYRRAVRRILWPAWGALVFWWALALHYKPFGVWLRWWLPIAQAMGYFLYVGTGWFITMILQWVASFPALEWLRRRTGFWLLVPGGLLATCGLTAYSLELVDLIGSFNYWVLGPRFAAHVVAGMVLARYRERVGWALAVPAGAAFAVCVLVDATRVGIPWQQQVEALGAIPLSALMLVALRPLSGIPVVAPAMVWLGQSSYGIYLGQLITHNFFVYRLGLLEPSTVMDPWLYTGVLLAGGLAFVWLGERVLDLLGPWGRPPAVQFDGKALDTPGLRSGS